MFSEFFIKRPIFATVISIIITLAGLLSIKILPVEEYPEVIPPQVSIRAIYPGATAETISRTVAAPIEQVLNGVENMIYMTSTSSSSGTISIDVSFEIGTDPDQATINVNNRVQEALPQLPEIVQQRGVTVQKRSSTILKIVSLYSDDGSRDPIFLSNYALINVLDDLRRIPGVGDAGPFAPQDYSMRIWLKPDKLAKYNLATTDVISILNEQNMQFAAGRFSQNPVSDKQAFTYSAVVQGQLESVEEFENIIVNIATDGSTLRLKDIARIELGAERYDFSAQYNGKAAHPIGIYLQPGANALDVSKRVDEVMKDMSARFPQGVAYVVPYDTTLFVNVSINEVVKTFFEAIFLVSIGIFLFLQSLRATIIPVLILPVSIIGTFAGMYMLGFSINLLTLFGLVLAIGIVIDDAILVIENVERIIYTDREISIKDATSKAMREVSGPIVATLLVLAAVFIPVAFMGGFTGQMYQQFAVTIVVSFTISSFIALTFTPAMCGVMLKREEKKAAWAVKFNNFIAWSTEKFVSSVKIVVKHGVFFFIVFVAVIFATYYFYKKIPNELVPAEDKGILISVTYLPPASSLSRSESSRDFNTKIILSDPRVEKIMAISGFDLMGSTLRTSAGASFIKLTDWSDRKTPEDHSQAISQAFNQQLMANQDAFSLVLNPPPIMGLSLSGGFEMYIQDRTGGDVASLNTITNQVIQAAMQRPELTSVRTTLSANVPQYKINVDIEKAKAAGIILNDIFTTLGTTFGNRYVNDFSLYGRTFDVTMQSESNFRETAEDLRYVFVRSISGEMIPLSSLATVERIVGPDSIERFNIFPAAKITGEPKPGYTSGDAIRAIEEVSQSILPEGYTIGWVGTSYQEKQASGNSSQAFIFGIIMVFLILAAQYERWMMPLAVITIVPFGFFGAVLATYFRGLSADIYFEVGLLTLIGLSAKNAILIVEFAMQRHAQGLSILEAALDAARLRFRAIIMTSATFIIGILPLALSTGAGAASRQSIGTGVIGGMIAATFLAIFFVPLFYYWLATIGNIKKKSKDKVIKEQQND